MLRGELAEALGDRVGPRLRLEPGGGGGLRDLGAVLVGAGQEERVVAALARVPARDVGRDRRVRVAEVRLGVHVVDRRRDVVGAHRGAASGQCQDGVALAATAASYSARRGAPVRRATSSIAWRAPDARRDELGTAASASAASRRRVGARRCPRSRSRPRRAARVTPTRRRPRRRCRARPPRTASSARGDARQRASGAIAARSASVATSAARRLEHDDSGSRRRDRGREEALRARRPRAAPSRGTRSPRRRARWRRARSRPRSAPAAPSSGAPAASARAHELAARDRRSAACPRPRRARPTPPASARAASAVARRCARECSSQTTSSGAGMPSAHSSARVRRVSSQAITSAARERVERAQRDVAQVAERRGTDGQHPRDRTGTRPATLYVPTWRRRRRKAPLRTYRGRGGDAGTRSRSAPSGAAGAPPRRRRAGVAGDRRRAPLRPRRRTPPRGAPASSCCPSRAARRAAAAPPATAPPRRAPRRRAVPRKRWLRRLIAARARRCCCWSLWIGYGYWQFRGSMRRANDRVDARDARRARRPAARCCRLASHHLVLGSDARPGETSSRSDSILLVRVDPARQQHRRALDPARPAHRDPRPRRRPSINVAYALRRPARSRSAPSRTSPASRSTTSCWSTSRASRS